MLTTANDERPRANKAKQSKGQKRTQRIDGPTKIQRRSNEERARKGTTALAKAHAQRSAHNGSTAQRPRAVQSGRTLANKGTTALSKALTTMCGSIWSEGAIRGTQRPRATPPTQMIDGANKGANRTTMGKQRKNGTTMRKQRIDGKAARVSASRCNLAAISPLSERDRKPQSAPGVGQEQRAGRKPRSESKSETAVASIAVD